jgi:hypothetical protein
VIILTISLGRKKIESDDVSCDYFDGTGLINGPLTVYYHVIAVSDYGPIGGKAYCLLKKDH